MGAGIGASGRSVPFSFHLPGLWVRAPALLVSMLGLGLGLGGGGGAVLTVRVEFPSTGGLLGASSCMTELLRLVVGEGDKELALFPSDLASEVAERWVSAASCFGSCDAFANSISKDEAGALIDTGSGL